MSGRQRSPISTSEMVYDDSLDSQSLKDLRALARQEGLSGYSRLKKEELVALLDAKRTQKEPIIQGIGYLEITKDGKGFLRSFRHPPSDNDVYVSPSQIKRFDLRPGDLVEGPVRLPKDGEKYRSLLKVTLVNNYEPDESGERPHFESLTPVFPDEQYVLETRPHILATRLIDMICPIGRGQRGLIVSPPRAGKTTLFKQIANALTDNYRGLFLMVVLIGERPEEVTDMRRSVEGLVVGTTFEEAPERHIHLAQMAFNHAMRLAEIGRDVVILLDSLTRLVRAHNWLADPAGRLPSGLNPVAVQPVRRLFGAARKLEGSGSLTVIATCNVETGNPLDDAIYDELKGTATMELHLDRHLAERRIYPAINIEKSGTVRDDLLLDGQVLQQVYTLRRMVEAIRISQPHIEPFLAIRDRLRRTRDNREFLASLNHRES
jgi:transcription termination factor Rho